MQDNFRLLEKKKVNMDHGFRGIHHNYQNLMVRGIIVDFQPCHMTIEGKHYLGHTQCIPKNYTQ